MIDRKIVKKVLTRYGILTGDRVLYEHTVTEVFKLVNKRELMLDKLVMKELTGLWIDTLSFTNLLNKKKKVTYGEVKYSLSRLDKKGLVLQQVRKSRRYWCKLKK